MDPTDTDSSSTEQASSVHLKGGANAKASFFDHGLTLTESSALSGLGGGDVVLQLSATAIPDARCSNPSGANQPPGQNPAEVTVRGSQAVPQSEIKNGNLAFSVTTQPPQTPIPGAPDCPNRQWTETIIDLAFTSAALTVEQPPGTTVFTLFCSFSPPTSNGSVPGQRVTCQ
jgi:hypothetical protein